MTTKCTKPDGSDTGKSFVFSVEFLSPCEPMLLDEFNTVFASPAHIQDVWQETMYLSWSDMLISVPDVALCGLVQFAIKNQDESEIDSLVFSKIFNTEIGAKNMLAIQTDDYTKAGRYYLRVEATYIDLNNVKSEKDFSIDITNTCGTKAPAASSEQSG